MSWVNSTETRLKRRDVLKHGGVVTGMFVVGGTLASGPARADHFTEFDEMPEDSDCSTKEDEEDEGKEMGNVTSADGTEIAFARSGTGPPLVLVHGTAGDHTAWDFVRPALEEHHTVYAMDRRGYGASGDADEYALEREFEDVAAVVESIDEPVVLFGHSFGAFISLEAALRTDNLRQLILYGPPIFSYRDRESIHEAKLPEMKALHDAGECEQMIVFFLREVAELPPAAIEEIRAAPDWQDTVDSAHAVFREIRAETEYEFDPARFADVNIPTLLLTGSESPARFHMTVGAVDVALPDSRITTLEGQGHLGISTAPDQVSEEVLAFIRESG